MLLRLASVWYDQFDFHSFLRKLTILLHSQLCVNIPTLRPLAIFYMRTFKTYMSYGRTDEMGSGSGSKSISGKYINSFRASRSRSKKSNHDSHTATEEPDISSSILIDSGTKLPDKSKGIGITRTIELDYLHREPHTNRRVRNEGSESESISQDEVPLRS